MTLLARLEKVNADKVKSKELKSELAIAIANYDDAIATSIDNAKTILELIESEYPEALKLEASKEEKEDKPKAEQKEEKPAKPKLTKESAKACQEVIVKMKSLLREYEQENAPKKAAKARKKRVSTILSEGMVSVLNRVVGREITKDKVGNVKPEKLRDARDKFSAGLKDIRSALGGISSENDTFIDSFETQFNALIKAVEEKQKSVAKETK